jgi:hypothetical protein
VDFWTDTRATLALELINRQGTEDEKLLCPAPPHRIPSSANVPLHSPIALQEFDEQNIATLSGLFQTKRRDDLSVAGQPTDLLALFNENLQTGVSTQAFNLKVLDSRGVRQIIAEFSRRNFKLAVSRAQQSDNRF